MRWTLTRSPWVGDSGACPSSPSLVALVAGVGAGTVGGLEGAEMGSGAAMTVEVVVVTPDGAPPAGCSS